MKMPLEPRDYPAENIEAAALDCIRSWDTEGERRPGPDNWKIATWVAKALAPNPGDVFTGGGDRFEAKVKRVLGDMVQRDKIVKLPNTAYGGGPTYLTHEQYDALRKARVEAERRADEQRAHAEALIQTVEPVAVTERRLVALLRSRTVTLSTDVVKAIAHGLAPLVMFRDDESSHGDVAR